MEIYKLEISDTNPTSFQCVRGATCLSGQKMGDCVPSNSMWTPSALEGAHWLSGFPKIAQILSRRDLEDNLTQSCCYRNEKTGAKEER